LPEPWRKLVFGNDDGNIIQDYPGAQATAVFKRKMADSRGFDGGQSPTCLSEAKATSPPENPDNVGKRC